MSRTLRITVLVENSTQRTGLLAEHGLAYWIETADRRLLFDTGQGNVLLTNAYRLKVPLAERDAIVLSHGHYDHAGGLADAIRGPKRVEVFHHPAALEAKYAQGENGSPPKSIGMPAPALRAMESSKVAARPMEAPTEIAPGVFATGPVPRVNDFETIPARFTLDESGDTPDPLLDDQSLYFDTVDGVVVLLGCAHAGVVNTLRYVDELTGDRPIIGVIGGTHLVGASRERIDRTIEALRHWDMRLLAPGHCTGAEAVAAIWNAFPGVCRTCGAGETFDFTLV